MKKKRVCTYICLLRARERVWRKSLVGRWTPPTHRHFAPLGLIGTRVDRGQRKYFHSRDARPCELSRCRKSRVSRCPCCLERDNFSSIDVHMDSRVGWVSIVLVGKLPAECRDRPFIGTQIYAHCISKYIFFIDNNIKLIDKIK